MTDYALKPLQKYLLLIASFVLVAFGQPAWVWWFGLLAAMLGYACFWRVLLAIPTKSTRFWLATAWYAGVQIVQLSWFGTHPFLYIFGLLLFLSVGMGIQFGIMALWITPKNLQRLPCILALAGFWAVMEWLRLFFLSGLSLNPAGMALTGAIYPLQFATIGGAFFLSFWVMLTNLLALKAWIQKTWVPFAAVALVPYLFGFAHYHWHAAKAAEHPNKPIPALLIQPAFPIEENIVFKSADEARQYVLDEWIQIFQLIAPERSKTIDLILLPEYVVPYGTFDLIYPVASAHQSLLKAFPAEVADQFAPVEYPYADYGMTRNGPQWMASNSFFAQSIANLFHAHVIAGLEDRSSNGEIFSSALHFQPNNGSVSRYDKRVLMPMGEYIPFECCREMAAEYGITGSFTPGKEAKLMLAPIPLGPSICYEEMFGHLMRENRQKGAELLVNLTNDGWYPHSRLAQQHFDHARLRTVEMGIPLARACNTGLTGVVDSLGRIVALLEVENEGPGALKVDVPTYHYATLYTMWGDYFVLALSGLFFLFALVTSRKNTSA